MSKQVIDRRGRTLLNSIDRFVDTAREASSRGAAFIFALIGIIAQLMHNGFLAYELTLIDNEFLRISQSIIVAMAISFAMMYFVLTADGKEYSRSTKNVHTFFILEVILNTFYYLRKIVFIKLQPQISDGVSFSDLSFNQINWFSLPVALAFAFFIPYIIKSYSGSINAHTPAEELDPEDNIKKEDINSIIKSEIESYVNNLYKETISEDIEDDEQKTIIDLINGLPTSSNIQNERYEKKLINIFNHIRDIRTSNTSTEFEDVHRKKIANAFNHIRDIRRSTVENVKFKENCKQKIIKLSKYVDDIKTSQPSIDLSDINKSIKTLKSDYVKLNSKVGTSENFGEVVKNINDRIVKMNTQISKKIETINEKSIKSDSNITLSKEGKMTQFNIKNV